MSLSKMIDEQKDKGNERQVFQLVWSLIEKIKKTDVE